MTSKVHSPKKCEAFGEKSFEQTVAMTHSTTLANKSSCETTKYQSRRVKQLQLLATVDIEYVARTVVNTRNNKMSKMSLLSISPGGTESTTELAATVTKDGNAYLHIVETGLRCMQISISI